MVALSEPGNPGGQDPMDVTLNLPGWTGRSRGGGKRVTSECINKWEAPT